MGVFHKDPKVGLKHYGEPFVALRYNINIYSKTKIPSILDFSYILHQKHKYP